MFADSLFESQWSTQSHRGWTTLLSFVLQALAVSGLLLLPLLYTQALPKLLLMGQLVAPTPPPGPPPTVSQPARNRVPSNMLGDALLTPARIPSVVADLNETEVPPAPDLSNGPWVPGGTGGPGGRSALTNLLGSGLTPLPPQPAPVVVLTRVSHMMEGNLVHRVQPDYPVLARQARVQGAVILRAVISRDGRIENLQVLSGHPMLVPAAMDAVRQWRYRPYVLNDQPVEVETQVTVNFILSGG